MTFVATGLASLALVSGLHGVVVRSPTTPVCRVGVPCSAPWAGAKLTFVRPSRSVSVTTDTRGRYRIALAPGRWAVRIAGARFGFDPKAVWVPTDRNRLQNFDVDTGIR